LVDRIAREAGFCSMAEVARWLSGMRINLESVLDPDELSSCAETYGRPSVS